MTIFPSPIFLFRISPTLFSLGRPVHKPYLFNSPPRNIENIIFIEPPFKPYHQPPSESDIRFIHVLEVAKDVVREDKMGLAKRRISTMERSEDPFIRLRASLRRGRL